jgi:uncharacterized membrane protein
VKTSEWITLISVAIGSGGLFGFVSALVVPLVRRPAVKAEATERLTEAAMQQVDQLQEEVREARRETRETRQEAREASQEAAQARRTVQVLNSEVEELTTKLHRLIGWIHEDSMTMDRLRILVPAIPPSAANGVGPASR